MKLICRHPFPLTPRCLKKEPEAREYSKQHETVMVSPLTPTMVIWLNGKREKTAAACYEKLENQAAEHRKV